MSRGGGGGGGGGGSAADDGSPGLLDQLTGELPAISDVSAADVSKALSRNAEAAAAAASSAAATASAALAKLRSGGISSQVPSLSSFFGAAEPPPPSAPVPKRGTAFARQTRGAGEEVSAAAPLGADDDGDTPADGHAPVDAESARRW
eukprot:3319744-Prymnesium_polylepis.1